MTPKSRSSLLWLWLLALAVFGLDQATKYGVFAWLPHERDEYVVVPGYFKFIHNQLNRGAVFGLGSAFGTDANWFFAGFSVLALGFILYWSLQPEVRQSKWLTVALGLIGGGALGNLYDRVMFHGVRDFLWFFIENKADPHNFHFNFAVFNFADSCLVCGAIMLLLHTFFVARPAEQPKTGEPVPAPAPTQG